MQKLIVLFIFCLLRYGEGQTEIDCPYRYSTINSFQSIDSVKISCYAVDGNCNLFYANPGTGCSSDSLGSLGTVPAGDTKTITGEFELGARFCSDNEFTVQHHLRDDYMVQLPRATDAGTKFRIEFERQPYLPSYICHASAFSTAAQVKTVFSSGPRLVNFTVEEYGMHQMIILASNLNVDSYSYTVESSSPIIFSCESLNTGDLVFSVMQPISSEPIFVSAPEQYPVSVVVVDCETNELVDYTNRARIECFLDGNNECDKLRETSSVVVYLSEPRTSILVTPLDDSTCVSASMQRAHGAFVAMALPESKLARRIVSYPDLGSLSLYSLSNQNCELSTDSGVSQLNFQLVTDFEEATLYSVSIVTELESTDSVTCPNGVFVSFSQPSGIIFSGGSIAESLWQQAFPREGCQSDELPTQEPTSDPTGGEQPPIATTSAGVRYQAMLSRSSLGLLVLPYLN